MNEFVVGSAMWGVQKRVLLMSDGAIEPTFCTSMDNLECKHFVASAGIQMEEGFVSYWGMTGKIYQNATFNSI